MLDVDDTRILYTTSHSPRRVSDWLRLEGVPPPRLEPEYVILLVKFVFKRIYPWWWASRRSDGNTISNKNSIVNDEF